MSMSLVGDYGGSESEEESNEEEEEEESEQEEEAEPLKTMKPKVSLPSAADLFDSVDTASFMSAPGPVPESPYTFAPKRKSEGAGSSATATGGSSNKKSTAGGEKGAKGEPSRGLIPPQMSRPNIVTEDVALWSSDATVKRQKRQLEMERRAGGAGGKGGVQGKELTFKQREKAKRDKGQASRGKSYVEEEKRLLRELGSS